MTLRALASQVDQLLRGTLTAKDQLQTGHVPAPARTLALAGLLLGALYGAMMGLYAATSRGAEGLLQFLATTVKVPLLFLLTLLVTFPSLYVLSALARSRLEYRDTLRLLLAAVTVNLAVLASFGPITAFFTLSTTSHAFLVVLNVLFFATAGGIGLGFLLKALAAVFGSEPRPGHAPAPAKAPAGDSVELGAPASSPALGSKARRVFTAWVVLFGVVGAQMGWILRPFIGDPERPFELFRERRSNFFAAVLDKLGELLR